MSTPDTGSGSGSGSDDIDGGGSDSDDVDIDGGASVGDVVAGSEAETTVADGASSDTSADAVSAPDTYAADAADAADAGAMGDAGDAHGKLAVLLGSMTHDGLDWVALPLAATPSAASSVKLIYGPQGGYHVWGAFCVPPSTKTPVAFTMGLTLANGGAEVLPGPVSLKTKLDAVGGPKGWACRTALTVFVTCACTVAGKAMKLRVDVVDAEGGVGSAETFVVPWHDFEPCSKDGTSACAAQ